MKAPQGTPIGAGVVVLDELQVEPELVELPRVPDLHEEAPIVGEDAGLYDLDLGQRGIEELHLRRPASGGP